jgi:hypothetical protein
MNFLSHYYLHRIPDDNDFTVGLTAPDLLGFHSERVRVTEKYLTEALENSDDSETKSCIRGMLIHLKVDKWFHGSGFFREKTVFLKDRYVEVTGHDDIPHHFCHILLEILLDRFLLVKDGMLADEFYASYKKFDFKKIAGIFSDLKNFDTEKFMTLTGNISNSVFLKEYLNCEKIMPILERVSNRIGFPVKLKPVSGKLTEFVGRSYAALEEEMADFFAPGGCTNEL